MELLTGKSEKQLIHLKPQDVYSEEAAEKVLETDEKVFRHNVSLTYRAVAGLSRWPQSVL